jgi:thioredoxin reductase (NADPH)
LFDWDVIVIGGGPAGLTAGLYLARGKVRTLLLEAESFGGKIKNLESVENYPGFAKGIPGAKLASEMQSQAAFFGLQTEVARVSGLEIYSSSRAVICQDGRSYTCAGIVLAGGSKPKKLNVPGEDQFYGKGVFTCAYCDGGQFEGKVVAVCGAGDAGLGEALYMSKIASKVIVLEALGAPTACAWLREKAQANPKVEIRCGALVLAIKGDSRVRGLEYREATSGKTGELAVDGLLVHIGLLPNSDYLPGDIELDEYSQVLVNPAMESSLPLVVAAGDIRSSSPGQVSTAVGDGSTAAISLMKQLQKG